MHKLTAEQTMQLKRTYAETFLSDGGEALEKSLYKSNEKLSALACSIIQEIAMIQYSHGAHSGGYVPVYAIGVGADEFKGLNDNAQIPRKLAKIIGTELK